MRRVLIKQFHRLGLFQVTWFIIGVLAWLVGLICKINVHTKLGEFGDALLGILNSWTLGIGVGVPTIAAACFWLLAWHTKGRLSDEAHRDGIEIANDAIAVIYNTLSFAACAMIVFACLNIGGNGRAFLLSGLCAEFFVLISAVLVGVVGAMLRSAAGSRTI